MKRNKFNLSNYKLFSCDMGELIPAGLTEVLPGDSIQHATSALVRASALLAPVMHPVHVAIHHWYVPHRLVWEDFEDFITGGPDGDDASVLPLIDVGGSGAAVGSLADYLGVPTGVADLEVSALPFRGYAMIWNEWYRDQDLQTELGLSLASGADSTTNVDLQNCDWEKDYFTTARPWEQKGTAASIPLSGTAPVLGIGAGAATTYGKTSFSVKETGGVDTTYADASGIDSAGANEFNVEEDPSNSGYPWIRADLSAAGATVDINDLRDALAQQRFMEARARFGSRYSEYLAYLGVRSSDARLQRPEYLGGGKSTLQFSEVLSTADSGTDLVGTLRGHGISALRSRRYRRFFEEHGYVFTFVNVKPKTMYVDGLDRHWNRRIKEDFWQKELQHIGQQEVLNKEVRAAHATPDGTFGYQDRYDEYRRNKSTISGEFRESVLDYWHFARRFGSDPSLNGDFVDCVPTQTPFAASTNDTLYVMAHHSMQARRLLSKQGTSFTF